MKGKLNTPSFLSVLLKTTASGLAPRQLGGRSLLPWLPFFPSFLLSSVLYPCQSVAPFSFSSSPRLCGSLSFPAWTPGAKSVFTAFCQKKRPASTGETGRLKLSKTRKNTFRVAFLCYSINDSVDAAVHRRGTREAALPCSARERRILPYQKARRGCW